MDGDIAPITEIVELAERYAMTYIDKSMPSACSRHRRGWSSAKIAST